MTYTAMNNTVWRGSVLVCQASTINYAQAIAEVMNKYESEGADGN